MKIWNSVYLWELRDQMPSPWISMILWSLITSKDSNTFYVWSVTDLNLKLNLFYLFFNKLSPLPGFKLGAPAPKADGLPMGLHASMTVYVHFLCIKAILKPAFTSTKYRTVRHSVDIRKMWFNIPSINVSEIEWILNLEKILL